MRSIPGLEGRYSITEDGKIYSHWGHSFMAPQLSKRGYFRIRLYTKKSKNSAKWFAVHRLVALTYLGPPAKPDLQVNHKDLVKTNNAIENLEYLSGIENIRHARASGKFGDGFSFATREQLRAWSKLGVKRWKEIAAERRATKVA